MQWIYLFILQRAVGKYEYLLLKLIEESFSKKNDKAEDINAHTHKKLNLQKLEMLTMAKYFEVL